MIRSSKPANRRYPLPWRGLIWQLFIITILPLTVLVLVIAFGSLSVHQKAMRALVGERDERAVQTAAAALEEQLKHRQSAILGLALRAQDASLDNMPNILASSDYLLYDFSSGLAVFHPDGTLVRWIGDQRLWESLSGQIAPLVGELRSKNIPSALTTSAFTHPISGEKIVLVLAVSSDGNRVAAGASTASELVSHTLTDSFASGPQASAIVVDSDHKLLYQSGVFPAEGELTSHPGIAEALHGESGATYIQVDNSEHVVSYAPVPALGWALVLEEPWETVATTTLRTTQIAPLVLVPVLLLTLLALWFGLRQIVQPLQSLESKAATLAWGDFITIEEPVGGIPEIRHLQGELVHMARKVQAAQQSLHDYIGAITAAQEDERGRMARELHDDTIQALIALKQRVQLAQMALHDIKAAKSLNEIAALTEQIIEDLRRVTRALRPIYLEDLGLVTALEMLARETSQAANIPVEFHLQGSEERLNPNVELALYRMAQEALNNVARHARASHASLSISFISQHVTVQINDDGVGFEVPKSPAEFSPNGHFGLLGLHERAELIGARLDIQSAIGRGSQVTIQLPYFSKVDGE
jgi:signal transduction histidine kinase